MSQNENVPAWLIKKRKELIDSYAGHYQNIERRAGFQDGFNSAIAVAANNPENVIKQEDAALLRETLAWCFKRVQPPVQQKIIQTLTVYAAKVGVYCQCPNRADLGMGKSACLDCGRRHGVESAPHEQNPIINNQ